MEHLFFWIVLVYVNDDNFHFLGKYPFNVNKTTKTMRITLTAPLRSLIVALIRFYVVFNFYICSFNFFLECCEIHKLCMKK